MKKKNIIFFLPNFDVGGAAQSITNTIINLNVKKYNLYIFCLGRCAYKKKLIKHKIKLFEIKKKRAILSFFQIKNIIVNMIEKTKLKTIFVSNINYANVLSLIFLSNITNLKIVTVDRTPIQELNYNYNNILLFGKNLIIKYLIKYIYKKANVRVGNSKTLSNDLSKFTKSKFYTIYPYSLKKILPFKKKIRKKNNIIKIFWIGRLSKEKSFMTLIKALALIKNENINVKVFGDGPEKNKYLMNVKKLGLDKKIKFIGYKKNINKYLKNADLYISTSFYEGFQNSMIEAINNNVPIITSNAYGGITDIINKNKFGYLYNIEDHINLSKLIKQYILNSNSFIKKSRLAKENLIKFKFHETNFRYEKIFDKI